MYHLIDFQKHIHCNYELLNLSALKFSTLYKNLTFQYMGKVFCVEFQRYSLKFLSEKADTI